MTETEIAWLAGLLEGEGCFFALPSTPKIALSMTDKDIVERAAGFFASAFRALRLRNSQKKIVWRTEVHGEKAIHIMQAILPHMGERRSQKIHEVLAEAAARPGVARGERNGHAKLTDAQAEEIKRCYVKGSRKKGERSSDLARRYGICPASLWWTVRKRQSATLTRK